MNFLPKIFRRDEQQVETRAAPTDLVGGTTYGLFNGMGGTDSGVRVNEETALQASAVFACARIIAEGVGTLPIHVRKREDGSKDYGHPLHRLLHDEPNEFMNASTFREAFTLNLCLWGGAFAYIDKDELGRPTGLYPLPSSHVRPQRVNGELSYQVRMPDRMHNVTPDRMFAVLTMSHDGITPVSPVRQSKQGIGLAIALERYAAKLFGNGANLGGVLSVPKMSDEGTKLFVESWKRNYSGPDNMFKTAVLPPDYKWTPTTIAPESGQMIESRVHQVREIARIYRVPPHMLGDLEKASYASVEAQSIEFAQRTLAPYTNKMEQESNRKLLLERERPLYEVKFNLDADLRATTLERYRAHTIGRQGGWLSINDVRRMEGLPPVDGGDDLLQPLNMAKVGTPAGGTRDSITVSSDTALDLIEDVAARLATKEARAVQKASHKFAGDPDGLKQWAGEFYTDHRDLAARHIAPVLKLAGIDTDPAEWAERYCQEAAAELRGHVDDKTPAEEAVDAIEGKSRLVAAQILNEGTTE